MSQSAKAISESDASALKGIICCLPFCQVFGLTLSQVLNSLQWCQICAMAFHAEVKGANPNT